ncbi:MAG: hypothetical protein D6803_01065 [Anaerolineae bacterium]|nr:MAG: hypothetical protein D6803_01065 [Anaerolineae bacterium]
MVSRTPALAWLDEKLNLCASLLPQVALLLEENYTPSPQADIALRYAPLPESTTGSVTLLGGDTLLAVAHPSIPVGDLESVDVRLLATSPQPPHTFYTYPAADELRQNFDAFVLAGWRLSPNARLAPNPIAMLQAIRAGEVAVGYVPQNAATGYEVASAPLTDAAGAPLHLDIVALTAQEPEGIVRVFVACLDGVLP